MKKLLAVILILPALVLNGQTITQFPSEPAQFVKELDNFMNATKREDCKIVMDGFAANVKSGAISSTQIEKMVEISNLMLERKMRAWPHFISYLQTVNNFVKAGKTEELFTSWSIILSNVISDQRRGDNKNFSTFMEFSDGFFSNGSLYLSQSKNWAAISDNFKLQYVDRPMVAFRSLDLMSYNASDTVIIKGTAGEYYILEQTWDGKEGKVDWTRAGLDPNSVYAEVKRYSIDFTKPEFTIDSVIFYHDQYFGLPLMGTYSNKLLVQKNEISYPRFDSFRKDLNIDDLTPNVKFVGGFALHGTKVIGTGDYNGKATLEFYQDKKKIVSVKAQEILLRKEDNLSAINAEVSLYMGKDSIYHPGLTMMYKIRLNELNLYRGEQGISATPFFDSYHQHEIKTDALIWKLDEPFINVKMLSGAGQSPASFTSANYFRKGEMEKFQGAMDFQPISIIKVYCDKNQTREIFAEDLAKKMNPNYTENTIKGLLFKLVEDGFIYYDESRSLITVKDKVFNYILANVGKIDYDVIKINSFSTQMNGKMYLDSMDIDLVGVNQVLLSDSQNVAVFPEGKLVRLQQDQDMAFSGKVSAGRLDFEGSGFHFEYDSFMIDLTNLAAAIIYVPANEKDNHGNDLLRPLASKIEGLTGILEIDHPKNKSGKKNYPNYPIFTNLEKSYVYYEDEKIHNKAYIKDSFYFLLDPFKFDSLDTFDPYLSDFGGSLVSAGIFPDFRENLRIQPDFSLGFKRTTPEKGYPIYRGRGEFTDSIFLSNAGLRGNGTVKYLFNTLVSNDIIFFPDSMNAYTQTFEMKKKTLDNVTYPEVKGADNFVHWLPYQDSMYVNMLSTPFYMYEDSATLKGNLLFTRKGLKGNGEFEFNEASLESGLFNFEGDALQSDTLSLGIKAIAEDKVTFNTPNVNGRVDFKEKIGEFKSNVSGIETEFANNKYKTSINEFFWDMEKNFLDFKAPPGTEGVYFTSTRADQDSLKFLSKRAFFDMSTSIIRVDSVPEILVADSRIIPDSNKVTILPGGLLDTLRNAVVITDTAQKFHKIYNAKLAINGKKGFTGDGIYDYLGEGLKPYPIIMDEIGVTAETQKKKTFYKTYADGLLEANELFLLHKKIEYKGLVNLQSERKNLFFDGYGKLDFANKSLKSDWFTMKDEIAPDSIIIHYNKPFSEQGAELFTGFYFNRYDSLSGIYAALLNPLRNQNDLKVFDATGILKYDSKNKTYYFGDEKRLTTEGLFGNMLIYDEGKNSITGEGQFDLGLKLEPIKISTAGNIVHLIDSNKFTFNTFLALDIPMEKDLLLLFAQDLIRFSFNEKDINYSTADFEKSLSAMLDEKSGKKAVDDLRKTGQFPKPKDIKNNFVFTDVKLLYDAEYQTYRSVGKFGISYVGDQPVHKMLDGYIEFGLRNNNDFFNIYIESSVEEWYYFAFNEKSLQILSSNKDFNKLLAALIPDKRQQAIPLQEQFYFYTVNTYSRMQQFLHRMKLIAEGKRYVEVDLSEEEIFQKEFEEIKKQLFEMEKDSSGQEHIVVPSNEKTKPDKKSSVTGSELPIMEEAEPPQDKKKSKKKEEPNPIRDMLQQHEQDEELKKQMQPAEPVPDEPVKSEPENPQEEQPRQEQEPVKEKKKSKNKKEENPIEEMLNQHQQEQTEPANAVPPKKEEIADPQPEEPKVEPEKEKKKSKEKIEENPVEQVKPQPEEVPEQPKPEPEKEKKKSKVKVEEPIEEVTPEPQQNEAPSNVTPPAEDNSNDLDKIMQDEKPKEPKKSKKSKKSEEDQPENPENNNEQQP